MIKNYLLIFCLVCSSLLADKPHLILYFDVNKTLIATDKASGKSLENVLNELLASHFQYDWTGKIGKAITYEDYILHIALPGQANDLSLKKERIKKLDTFLQFLKETNHPLYCEANAMYKTLFCKLYESKSPVFASFYKLLGMLDGEGYCYTLILRSYGEEVYDIAKEINKHYRPLFKGEGHFKKGHLFIQNKELNHPQEIYQFFKHSPSLAIRDDWNYWSFGKLATLYAKPFLVDSSDKSTLSLFFDDNINQNEEQNIISPIDVQTGKKLSIQSLINKYQAVPVNTMEAILNDNYYIQLVNKAIETHAKTFCLQ